MKTEMIVSGSSAVFFRTVPYFLRKYAPSKLPHFRAHLFMFVGPSRLSRLASVFFFYRESDIGLIRLLFSGEGRNFRAIARRSIVRNLT